MASYGATSFPEYTPRLETVPRPGRTQSILERFLPAQRLDGDVDAAAARQAANLRYWVLLAHIDHMRRTEAACHLEALRDRIDTDNERGAAKFGTQGRAQADWTLSEYGDRVTHAHIAALGAAESGREDVWQQDDLLVTQAVRYHREVGPRIRHAQVLGPCAVDGVAEAPSAQRTSALCVRTAETAEALPARRDGPDDDTLTDAVFGLQPVTECRDHADGFVPEDQPGTHRILASHDVDVCPADRRRRDADDRLARPRNRNRTLFDAQLIGATKDNCLHGAHMWLPS